MKQTAGIHHITAFAGKPQDNVDFYAGVLGLRMIKRTINFDAPDIYHLYFGNEYGSPGTAMTFFPASDTPRGQVGAGQVGYTNFALPIGSLSFWEKRLKGLEIPVAKHRRFSQDYLRFTDFDGLQLELSEREDVPASTWTFAGVPLEHAIKGFGGAVFYSLKPLETMKALDELLGFQQVGQEGDYVRYQVPGEYGNIIDVFTGAVARGQGGAGTIHHIAWRAKDGAEQAAWREAAQNQGFRPTEIIDRQYFQSIYFRERGGILYEIATDGPGFTVDEALETLGQKLMLPPWYEEIREQIQANLEPITLREVARV